MSLPGHYAYAWRQPGPALGIAADCALTPERAGLLSLFDPIRHTLGDHDGRGVRIGMHHIRHDRGIDYTQTLQTVRV
jgi:hypothetical protein